MRTSLKAAAMALAISTLVLSSVAGSASGAAVKSLGAKGCANDPAGWTQVYVYGTTKGNFSLSAYQGPTSRSFAGVSGTTYWKSTRFFSHWSNTSSSYVNATYAIDFAQTGCWYPTNYNYI